MTSGTYIFSISGVSQANPCVITTDVDHGFQTKQVVRVSDLGDDVPTTGVSASPTVMRGMGQINGNKYSIIVLDSTSFSLHDSITLANVDSTNYTAWVSGGKVTLETRALRLNYPQTRPYSKENSYLRNPYIYEA